MVVLRFAGGLAALCAFALSMQTSVAETPKHCGILNYAKGWKIKI